VVIDPHDGVEEAHRFIFLRVSGGCQALSRCVSQVTHRHASGSDSDSASRRSNGISAAQWLQVPHPPASP